MCTNTPTDSYYAIVWYYLQAGKGTPEKYKALWPLFRILEVLTQFVVVKLGFGTYFVNEADRESKFPLKSVYTYLILNSSGKQKDEKVSCDLLSK